MGSEMCIRDRLNAVLSSQLRTPISEVTFLPTIQLPDIAAHKESIVDVICRDALGKQWIVEMQVAVSKGFEKRAQYYAYKAFISQMGKGSAYQDLQEVIFLAFVNFDIFPHKLHYKSEHVTLDKKSGDHDLDRISFTFVDLKKFERQPSKHVSQLTLEEKFYYYLVHASTASEAELEQLIGEDPILRKAWEELNAYYWNEEELLMYERAERNRLDFEAMIAAAEDKGRGELDKEKEKAEQIGIEKGEKIGIEKGKQIGVEEGKQEAQAEMVRKLHAKGKSIQEIADLTDLPKLEVERAIQSPK